MISNTASGSNEDSARLVKYPVSSDDLILLVASLYCFVLFAVVCSNVVLYDIRTKTCEWEHTLYLIKLLLSYHCDVQYFDKISVKC